MPDTFFFRIRGEVKGPFSREQIMTFVRRKRLGRHHELSSDGLNWQRAGEIEELFESNLPEDLVAWEPIGDNQESAVDTRTLTAANHVSSNLQQPTGGPDDWYYAKGHSTNGPISSKDLRALLVTGRVLGTDRIWNESLSGWIPASDVSQFAGAIPLLEPHRVAKRVPRSSFFDICFGLSNGPAMPVAALEKYPNLCRYVTIGESVFRILFILEIFIATGWYVFMMFGLIQIGNIVQIAFGLFVGAAALLLAIAFLWFMFLASMAMLDVLKVIVRIEDNSAV